MLFWFFLKKKCYLTQCACSFNIILDIYIIQNAFFQLPSLMVFLKHNKKYSCGSYIMIYNTFELRKMSFLKKWYNKMIMCSSYIWYEPFKYFFSHRYIYLKDTYLPVHFFVMVFRSNNNLHVHSIVNNELFFNSFRGKNSIHK